jgi:O-antigen/teichoic acid export membrane protein
VGGQPAMPGGLRLVQAAVRRFSWGLADQAMSSLSNAAMSLYIARQLGATQFGAFSVAYVTYSFVLNASRGLATDPLLVRYSHAEHSVWRRAVKGSTATAAVVGVIMGIACLVVGAIATGTTGVAFLALGVSLPGLMLQDSWRYSFFALGKGGKAFVNDTIWTAGLGVALEGLRLSHHQTVFWFVLMWGLTANLAALCGLLQARLIPHLGGVGQWLSQMRDLGPRYLIENTATSGSGQLRIYAVGFVAGLTAVGYVQEGSLLMGPFFVIFMGISLVTVPEATRMLARSTRHLHRYCVLVGVALSILALCWGLILLFALPRGLGTLLLHAKQWQPVYGLVIWLTLSMMGACVTAGAVAGLRALGVARRSLRANLIASSIYVVLGVLGAVWSGAVGSVEGTALATWLGAGVYWWLLRVGLREHDSEASRFARIGGPAPPVGEAVPAAGPGEIESGTLVPAGAPTVPFRTVVPVGAAAVAFPTVVPVGAPTVPFRALVPACPAAVAVRPAPRIARRRTTEASERTARRLVKATWFLLVVNVMTFFPRTWSGEPLVVPIPSVVGKLITQGALPVALLLALTVNRRKLVRPSMYLGLYSLIIIEVAFAAVQAKHFGTTYRVFRLAGFVATLWLLTPWWGRKDLFLVKCHVQAMAIVLGQVLLGYIISPSRAMGGGRLGGDFWPTPPTQVAEFAAITVGLVIVLWLCRQMSGRVTLLACAICGFVLIESHTRTALVAMAAGLLVAGLSVISVNRRVRKVFAWVTGVVTVAILTLSSFLTTWLARGEGTEQLTDLTGRTNVWAAVENMPRDKFQVIFGFGLSNKSYNGLPVDSNWLACYLDEGLAGVILSAIVLLFVLISAFFMPQGKSRALALFLSTYVLIASFTETGFSDASSYLLELTLAASLIMPSVFWHHQEKRPEGSLA